MVRISCFRFRSVHVVLGRVGFPECYTTTMVISTFAAIHHGAEHNLFETILFIDGDLGPVFSSAVSHEASRNRSFVNKPRVCRNCFFLLIPNCTKASSCVLFRSSPLSRRPFLVQKSSRKRRQKCQRKSTRSTLFHLELRELLDGLASARQHTEDVESDLETCQPKTDPRTLSSGCGGRSGRLKPTVLLRGRHWPTVTWSPSSTRKAGETWAARFLCRFS